MAGEADLSLWTLGFTIGAVVVVIVAVLLLGIIWQARRIVRLASTALEVVGEIDTHTRPVWSLNTTNKVAGELLGGAKAIEANAGAIVEALSHSDRGAAA